MNRHIKKLLPTKQRHNDHKYESSQNFTQALVVTLYGSVSNDLRRAAAVEMTQAADDDDDVKLWWAYVVEFPVTGVQKRPNGRFYRFRAIAFYIFQIVVVQSYDVTINSLFFRLIIE